MRKLLGIVLAVLLVTAGMTIPADAGLYWFQVRDENGKPVTSGFTVQAYTVASQAHDVVFTDTGYGTQKTNPMNPNTQGVVAFATTSTTVDLVVWGTGGAAKGAVGRFKDATDTDHIITLQTQNAVKHLRGFWDRAISKGGETSTGITLPVGATVKEAWVEVATGTARVSISVGLLSTEASGDADGFCASQGVDFAAAPGQFFRCEASRTAYPDVGKYTGYWWSSNTRGALLSAFGLGKANSGSPYASFGQFFEFPHVVQEGAAKTISYTVNDIGAAAGYWHLLYEEMRRR